IGFIMSNTPADAPHKYDLYPLHKAFGFIVLLLLMVRVPTRFRGKIPDPSSTLKDWEVKLSHLVHVLLYLSMLSMTISGFLMNSTYPYVQGLDLFGLITVPDITPKSEFWNGIMHTIHSVSAWTLTSSLVLHLVGVIKHRYLDGPDSDVLKRMI
ncbi:MAG: cytochrome b/b6 domain-containing protein, partial [Kangiellaceae bacterium]|nr:cytochrome b/b6 domain-containing protein [Kangiellaceae bacterium]